MCVHDPLSSGSNSRFGFEMRKSKALIMQGTDEDMRQKMRGEVWMYNAGFAMQ